MCNHVALWSSCKIKKVFHSLALTWALVLSILLLIASSPIFQWWIVTILWQTYNQNCCYIIEPHGSRQLKKNVCLDLSFYGDLYSSNSSCEKQVMCMKITEWSSVLKTYCASDPCLTTMQQRPLDDGRRVFLIKKILVLYVTIDVLSYEFVQH